MRLAVLVLLPALAFAEPSPPPRKWQQACAEMLKLAFRDVGLTQASVEFKRATLRQLQLEMVLVSGGPDIDAASVTLALQQACPYNTEWERHTLLMYRENRSFGCYTSIISATEDKPAFFKRMRLAADACMQLPAK